MKITKAVFINGEARFIIDGDTTKTYCINLEGKSTLKEVTDELKSKIIPKKNRYSKHQKPRGD